MVANWDATRRILPAGQAVMITDASNTERDQINALAQEHRARAGELGSHQVELPGKPYGLAAGDEIIFTAQHHAPGQQRIENGITGTITDTSRNDEHHVSIKTRENPPREVNVNTNEFHELSLGYAVRVYKGIGLTAERAGVLTGGWQTDRENAYVALSRARDQTDIYLSREDLGQDGLDPEAIEHLAQLMQQSHAQQASITREPVQPTADHSSEIRQNVADRPTDISQRPTPRKIANPRPIRHWNHNNRTMSRSGTRSTTSSSGSNSPRPACERADVQPTRETAAYLHTASSSPHWSRSRAQVMESAAACGG